MVSFCSCTCGRKGHIDAIAKPFAHTITPPAVILGLDAARAERPLRNPAPIEDSCSPLEHSRAGLGWFGCPLDRARRYTPNIVKGRSRISALRRKTGQRA